MAASASRGRDLTPKQIRGGAQFVATEMDPLRRFALMFKATIDSSKPVRCVCYARVSTKRQNRTSPDPQLAAIVRAIKRSGLPWGIVDTHCDVTVSSRHRGHAG